MKTHGHGQQRGQVLILFALFLVVLIGATAIAVDYGSWLKVRRDYQNVTDAAVLAGGGFLSRPIDKPKRDNARRAAWDSLNNQLGLGLTGGELDTLEDTNTPAGTPSVFGDYKIWVSTPPVEAGAKYPGAYAGASDRYLFAWIEKDNPSFFSQVFGQGDRNVSAWATAGVFAGQFAVITLRQNGQGPVNAPSDIVLDGNNTILEVANGDVGGNWGMKLTGASNLYLTGDADAYLVDYVSCGNSCWSANQVSDGGGNLKTPMQLPSIIEDPDYPLPSVLSEVPVGPTSEVPRASGTGVPPPPANDGSLTITKGTIVGTGCSATSPRIGPGWYNNLTINGCVVLDPTHNYSDPNDDVAPIGDYGMTDVPSTQQAGIFYITGTLDVGQGSLVVGDGVTVVLRPPNGSLKVTGNGLIDLNLNLKKAAYQTDGRYSYSFNSTSGIWQYSANNNDKSSVGIALYVVKPAQYGVSTSDASTSAIDIAATAALSWQGVLYAPRDNVKLAGQPYHNAIGQFIAWTAKVAGGARIVQTYDGPGEAAPRLVEPRLGQ